MPIDDTQTGAEISALLLYQAIVAVTLVRNQDRISRGSVVALGP